MTLTTRDIQEKQFHDAFRGYSHEEVDVFIDQVAESFDQLAREKHALTMRIEELQEQLRNAQAQGPDDMLKRLLVTAQETADKAIQNARAKAQGMIEEAENRARLIREQAEALSASRLQEAERRAQQTLASVTSEERDLRSKIEGMKKFEKEFRARLTAFIRSQLDLLEKTSMAQPETPEDFASAEIKRSIAQQEPRMPSAAVEVPSWDDLASDPFLPEAGDREDLSVRESFLELDYPSPQPSDLPHPAMSEPGPPPGEPVSGLLDEELPGDVGAESSSRERGPGPGPPDHTSVPRTAQPTQPVVAPNPGAASEPKKEPKPKDENRSIRELFWGEE
ncbi:MAG TPA: DivIVA domain-containing protein [Actinomycetota bacterium]|nr:DivIVA domain-containing protein [Actinomycetota bacterium]